MSPSSSLAAGGVHSLQNGNERHLASAGPTRHALHAGSLPLHHADPFDRLLIAQAQLENLKILTVDGQFEAYEVDLLWA